MTPADLLWLAIAIPIAAYLIALLFTFLLLTWLIATKPFPFI
jgi:hypothetical protein